MLSLENIDKVNFAQYGGLSRSMNLKEDLSCQLSRQKVSELQVTRPNDVFDVAHPGTFCVALVPPAQRAHCTAFRISSVMNAWLLKWT